MARSQRLADIHVVRERKITGSGCHPVSADYHSAVVKRRVVLENIDQKLACDNSVHLDAGSLHIRQRRLHLNNHKSSRFHLSHLETGSGQLVNRLLAETFFHLSVVSRENSSQHVLAPQLLQRLSELRLKNDNKRCNCDIRCFPQQPEDGVQLQYGSHENKTADKQNSL